MLDIKSKLVLKWLTKECPNGAFKIVEAKDIISAMPQKYRVDGDGLNNILIYLERQEFISIKYDDDGVYCLCVLPYGNEVLEMENKQKTKEFSPKTLKIFIIISFLSSLCASFLTLLVAYFLIK